MSVQKQHTKPSYFSFCPAAPLVVAGTAVYGHLDEASASQPVLEILSLDLAKPGLEIPRIGASVPLKSSLLSVEWGSFGIAAKKSKYGILAGSLSSGEVVLWDPMAIVNQATSAPAIHTWKPSENGQVNSLAFNPHTPSMLACGTSAGEVLLYDITNPHEPRDALASPDAPSGTVAPYAPQFRSGPGEVLSLKFNNVSPHIIAIGFANGATHLYDSRNRRKVLEFVDENLPRRIAGVAWAPSDETHLVLASEDDRSPTLQFWDLRKARAPTLEFVGHSRGVTDVAWCPQDVGLLLSSGKDAQSIVWDTRSGERLGCLHANEPGPSIQVRWSPLSHGMFLSSQAGKGIHMAHYTGIACSFEAATDPTSGQLVSQRVSRPLPRPPAWMRRRAVARFGFGGKLAMAKPPMGRDSVRSVNVRTLTLEPELKNHSEAFEEAMSGDLRSYCHQKAHGEADPEREYWSFIEVLLGSDEERLPEMLSRLGFANEVAAGARPGASEQVENVTALLGASSLLSSDNNTHAQPEDGTRPFFDVDNPPGTSPRGTGGGSNTPVGAGGGATSFFDNLGAGAAATPTAAAAGRGASANIGQTLSIGDSGALEGEAEGETDLQRHLFVGNHAAAVSTCLSHDRLADALVVAHVSNDPALWRSTLSRYTELCPQPYLRVVEAQMRDDYESLIKARPVGRWAETAAILLTYVPQPDFRRLCTKLAKRLDESGMRHAAALCYICCADVDAAVTLWLSEATDASLPVPRLQSVLEKSISLCLAATHQAATTSLADLLANYALRLVDQGAMRSAITYLSLLDQLPTDSALNLAVLKDRVSQCSPSEVPEGIQPAMFPYEYVLVPTSAQGAAAQQEVYATYAAQYQQHDYSQQYSVPSSATSQYPANNNYGGYGTANTGASAYSQFKYDPSGSYGQDNTYLNQQYAPAEPKPPAKSHQHHGYAPQQPAQQSPYSTAPRAGNMRTAAPPPPAAHSYAPQAPKPVAQASMQPSYHQPQHHAPPPAKPATQFAPRPTPQPYSPSSQYSHSHQAPVPDAPPQKQPAVFQPMHAQAPRHAMAPQPAAPAPQPAAPPAPAPPPPPPGPPADCSIYNVDTSSVSGPAQQVVQNLYSLFQACEPLAQQALQQREMEDNAKKLGILFWKLNAHELSDEVVGLLVPLAQALTSGDIATAKSIHVKLTGSHWSECSQWLQVIKRLMKARQQLQ